MSSRAARWLGKEIALGVAAPVTNAAADGYLITENAFDALDGIRRGGRGLRKTVVAGEFFHGGGDRKNALAQLGTDFLTFHNDLVKNATLATCAEWIAADVAPTLAEWQNFVARMAATPLAAYVTEWSVFESWFGRLVRLRAAARSKGVVLESADPQPLPQTVWERGATGTGSALDVWIAAGKTAVFGAVAITGIFGFYAIVRDLHGIAKRKWAR